MKKMKVEHKKKERIKQIAADRRTAQKFFLIQVLALTSFSFCFLFDWLWCFFLLFFFDWLLGTWVPSAICFRSCPVLHWWCWCCNLKQLYFSKLYFPKLYFLNCIFANCFFEVYPTSASSIFWKSAKYDISKIIGECDIRYALEWYQNVIWLKIWTKYCMKDIQEMKPL